MNSHFFVRTLTLPDQSTLYEVQFFDGGNGDSDTTITSSLSVHLADRICDELNLAAFGTSRGLSTAQDNLTATATA